MVQRYEKKINLPNFLVEINKNNFGVKAKLPSPLATRISNN